MSSSVGLGRVCPVQQVAHGEAAAAPDHAFRGGSAIWRLRACSFAESAHIQVPGAGVCGQHTSVANSYQAESLFDLNPTCLAHASVNAYPIELSGGVSLTCFSAQNSRNGLKRSTTISEMRDPGAATPRRRSVQGVQLSARGEHRTHLGSRNWLFIAHFLTHSHTIQQQQAAHTQRQFMA